MFKNFFISWGLHVRLTLYQYNPDIMAPYIVPGFGNGKNRINGSFSYNIEYLIPWKSAKNQPPKNKTR